MKNVIWVLAWVAVLYRGYMLLDNVNKSNPHNVVWVALSIVSTTVLLLVIGAFIEDIQRERERKIMNITKNLDLAEGFWLMKGDRVRLKKELDAVGEVLSVDLDCYPLNVYGVTTAQVLWDDAGGVPDIQWTNKLEKVEE